MSVPKYTALTDMEILDRSVEQISYVELADEYAKLREHHIAETAVLAAKDRVLLVQTAAAIVAGSLAGPPQPSFEPMKDAKLLIVGAVHMAQMILAEVDKA